MPSCFVDQFISLISITLVILCDLACLFGGTSFPILDSLAWLRKDQRIMDLWEIPFTYTRNPQLGISIVKACLVASIILCFVKMCIFGLFHHKKYSTSKAGYTYLRILILIWLLDFLLVVSAPVVFLLTVYSTISPSHELSTSNTGVCIYLCFANACFQLFTSILIFLQWKKYKRWQAMNFALANFFK